MIGGLGGGCGVGGIGKDMGKWIRCILNDIYLIAI